VHCSNLFIEGQKVSAVTRGVADSLDDVKQRSVIDVDYRLDLHCLMALPQHAEGNTRAVVFGSITETNEGLWRHAAKAGVEVVTVERGFSGRRSASTPA